MSTTDEIKIMVAENEALGLPTTATDVVENSMDADKFPALHQHLWGPSEADLAMEARIQRAHRMLIRVTVVNSEGVVSRMVMHTVGTEGYRHVSTVASRPDLAVAKLEELKLDIARARGRLSAFRAMLSDDLGDEIDDYLRKAEDRIKTVSATKAGAAA